MPSASICAKTYRAIWSTRFTEQSLGTISLIEVRRDLRPPTTFLVAFASGVSSWVSGEVSTASLLAAEESVCVLCCVMMCWLLLEDWSLCWLTFAPNGTQHAIHAHTLHGLHGCGFARKIEWCVGDRIEDCGREGRCGVVIIIFVVVDLGIIGVIRSIAAQRQRRWNLSAAFFASRLRLLLLLLGLERHWHSRHAPGF